MDKDKKLIARINRIEGQVRGIKKMMENGECCDDVLNQISSVRAALGGLSKVILENHLKKCVVNGVKQGEEEKTIDELIYILGKMLK